MGWVLLGVILAGALPAGAQTPEVPAATAHKVKKPVVKHKSASPPVVAPRHHGVVRHKAPAPPPLPPKSKKKLLVRKEVAKPAVVAHVAPKKPPPPPPPADVGTNTKLHLPRYAALKSDDVNMRKGPGERYPVDWIYKRHDLPVKIEREFDIWRLVEDMDGYKGWVHQATLTGRRNFVVIGTADQPLRADGMATAAQIAILKPGVIGRIKSCEAGKDWCQVQVGDYRGWLPRSAFWGADPGEVIAP